MTSTTCTCKVVTTTTTTTTTPITPIRIIIITVGDTYMAGAGLPTPTKTHALDMAYFAFAFAKEIEHFNKHYKLGTDGRAQKLDYKIGISSGPIVAGVIGKKNPVYDLWGKSRVERRNKCLSQRVEKKVLHV